MARKATGKVIEHGGTDGLTYRALRFTAYGKRRYVSLGAITADVAERELRHVRGDVERGIWQPPRQVEPPAEAEPLPTFHVLAEEWWVRNEGQLAENTRAGYRWRLECHLLPAFGEVRIDRIDFDAVERYIADKLTGNKPLSPKSINMTVTLLAAILEGAEERGLIDRNPARGKRRRARERRPVRSHLDSAQPIKALLEAAGELDREARHDRRHVERRANARGADLRRAADQRAMRAAVARRGSHRGMATHWLQDRRRMAAGEDQGRASGRAARSARPPRP
ncbi:MAG: hypothetical protein ABSH36_17760, partial [Solirubrobacteraceae bacterium]